MLTQTSVPGTDDWYLMQLAAQYGADLPRLFQMKSYDDGTNNVPADAEAAMREAYRQFIRLSRLNMADLVVSAKVNRQKPIGFRTAVAGDNVGDSLAWANWKRSGMLVGARNFLRDAGIYGSAYLLTTGPQSPSADAKPLIVPKNGWSIATIQNAVTPWITDAALMVGHDPINGVDVLTLFRPGYMRMAMRQAGITSIPSDGTSWLPGRGWSWVSDPVPLGYTDQVPVFKMSGPSGKGMFEKHLDSLDRITVTIRDRLTIAAMQAFKQRALKGELPEFYPNDHPTKAGQPIPYDDIFKAGPAAIWRLPVGMDIWESAVTDITPIISATKEDTKNLAAATQTALYILSPDAASGSAEGASLIRESLVFSVEEWNDHASMPIALAQSSCFLAQGDSARADVGDIEIIWAPVDRSSIIERAAASASAKQGGMTQKMIDEKIFQYTPAELAEAQQQRSDEQFAAPVAS